MTNTASSFLSSLLQRLHIDAWLMVGLIVLMGTGLVTIYSAGGEDIGLIHKQVTRLGIGLAVMFFCAQIPIHFYRSIAPIFYLVGVLLLVAVLFIGVEGKGAQRWLDLGFMRFQPSEILKLFVPMTIAWYLSQEPLPPKLKHVLIGFLLVLIPALFIARQPDLGTALLIASSGLFALFLAGLSWRIITVSSVLAISFIPVMWFFLMKAYQKQRVITFLNPESDPLGAGYHIIQSKIAIGSGGISGKGWLKGSQSQLEFLPERHTDFIFSVFSEEFGLIGVLLLLALYGFIIVRGLIIAGRSQFIFCKLLAGSITLTFFVYVFVNIGMVSGLLPVVGVPLPLVSYGGTSMVTLLAGFGIVMAVATQKKVVSR